MITQEIEKKALLSQSEYQACIDHFIDKPMKQVEQINYYYDDDVHTFFKRNETLRVRQIENFLELQFKYDKSYHRNVRTSKELIDTVQYLPESVLIHDVKTKCIGSMLTKRKMIEYNQYILFLDKNYYLGILDYEIEIESNDANNIPTELLDIDWSKPCCGKYARFVNALLKQRAEHEISK